MNKIINDIKKQANQINFDKEYLSIETKDLFENIIILKDGRISGCNGDGKIIIFNKEKYDSIDLTIKLFKNSPIFYHCQLNDGQIIACSKSIKIIKLKINYFFMETYEIVQEIETHSGTVFNKVITLDENRLIASLNDSSINLYIKRNKNKYMWEKMFEIGQIKEYALERTILLKINDNEFVGTSRKIKCGQFFIGGDSFLSNVSELTFKTQFFFINRWRYLKRDIFNKS